MLLYKYPKYATSDKEVSSVNANMIRGKIAEAGLTQGKLAQMVGMSMNSMSRKLAGKRDFKLEEVQSICAALNIDDPAPYFFTNNFPNTQQAGSVR